VELLAQGVDPFARGDEAALDDHRPAAGGLRTVV
jgi:hypothetical protein